MDYSLFEFLSQLVFRIARQISSADAAVQAAFNTIAALLNRMGIIGGGAHITPGNTPLQEKGRPPWRSDYQSNGYNEARFQMAQRVFAINTRA